MSYSCPFLFFLMYGGREKQVTQLVITIKTSNSISYYYSYYLSEVVRNAFNIKNNARIFLYVSCIQPW